MAKKLVTAEALYALFSDAAKLKEYKYFQPVVSSSGIDNEKFHMDLPYEEIKAAVEVEMAKVFAKLPEPEKSKVTWQQVGSTSIKGMPGTMHPDALVLVPEFPPSRPVIQALLDCGFYFSRSAPLDPQDLWFFYLFPDGLLQEHKLTIHLTTPDNVAGKILIDTRDICRNEEWAFEDYKQAKVAASQASDSFIGYKMAKGKGSKVLQMMREKHGFKMPEKLN